MKESNRLKLEDFQAKNLKKDTAQQVNQLLGQVLGDCHDSSAKNGALGSNPPTLGDRD